MAAALVATATAACAGLPTACPAVGYSSTLTVTLAEPHDGVALELCVTQGCTPRALDDVPVDEPIEVCDSMECVTASPQPEASADDGIWMLERGDGVDGWTITIFTGGTAVGYRLLDPAGAVLDEGEAEPDWVRVGGSEQCGGPSEAEIVLG